MDLKVLLTFSVLLPASYGYPGGAPAGACSAMSPNHGGNAQTTAPAYTITTSANTYGCGGTVTVTLGGGTFKGFLCQARPDASTLPTVGSLGDSSVSSAKSCTGVLAKYVKITPFNLGRGLQTARSIHVDIFEKEAALTHTESSDKTSLQFTWTHGGTSTSNITFVCTVVQARLTYWENVMSSPISFSGSSTTCSGTSHVMSSMILLCVCFILNIVKG